MAEQFDQPSQPGVDGAIDQPAAPASGDGEPTAPSAAPAPEWTPEQVQQWKSAYDNQHAWAKENTERAQYVADRQRAIEAAERQFYSDPINRQIYQLRQQVYNPDGTLNEERLAQLERLAAGVAQGGQDPLVANMAAKVRQLEGTVMGMTWAQQQAQEQAILRAGMREAEEFRAELGAEEFPNTPEGDAAFEKFMREEYPQVGADRIKDAYRLARWDTLTARERETARAQMSDKDLQARAASTGLQPGAHEPPPPVEGDPKDVHFLGAQERAKQLYGDIDYDLE